MVEVEANEFRIAVRVSAAYLAGPAAPRRSRCSFCGTVHEKKRIKDYPAIWSVVRNASKRPRMKSGLAATFCEECHKKNQAYLERCAGISIGATVKMDVFNGGKVLTVAGYYDEKTFIDEGRFVHKVSGIEKVLGKQSTIFDFVEA